MCDGAALKLGKTNIHYFRSFCPFAHCWRIPTLMTRLCLKLPTCTRLTRLSMKPLLVAGHRSMPWDNHAPPLAAHCSCAIMIYEETRYTFNECFVFFLSVEINHGKGIDDYLWIFLCKTSVMEEIVVKCHKFSACWLAIPNDGNEIIVRNR